MEGLEKVNPDILLIARKNLRDHPQSPTRRVENILGDLLGEIPYWVDALQVATANKDMVEIEEIVSQLLAVSKVADKYHGNTVSTDSIKAALDAAATKKANQKKVLEALVPFTEINKKFLTEHDYSSLHAALHQAVLESLGPDVISPLEKRLLMKAGQIKSAVEGMYTHLPITMPKKEKKSDVRVAAAKIPLENIIAEIPELDGSEYADLVVSLAKLQEELEVILERSVTEEELNDALEEIQIRFSEER